MSLILFLKMLQLWKIFNRMKKYIFTMLCISRNKNEFHITHIAIITVQNVLGIHCPTLSKVVYVLS